MFTVLIFRYGFHFMLPFVFLYYITCYLELHEYELVRDALSYVDLGNPFFYVQIVHYYCTCILNHVTIPIFSFHFEDRCQMGILK